MTFRLALYRAALLAGDRSLRRAQTLAGAIAIMSTLEAIRRELGIPDDYGVAPVSESELRAAWGDR